MSDFERPDEELSLDELLSDAAQYLDDAPSDAPSADARVPAPADAAPDEAPFYDAAPDAPAEDVSAVSAPVLRAPMEPEDAPLPANGAQEDFSPDFGSAFDDYGDYEGAEDAPQSQRPAKKQRHHLKKFKFPALLKLAIYFAIVVLLGVLLANTVWSLADDVLALTRPDLEIEVRINTTDTLDDITDTLKSVGAIKYDWLFKTFCKVKECEEDFDPGVYTINLNYDYNALVNNLQRSAVGRESVTVMIIEGSSCEDIFTLLEQQEVCTKHELEQCAAETHFDDYAFLDGLPYGDANRLEGYLFPDTYEFYVMDDPERVLNKILRNFNNKLDEDLMARVEETGMSLHEVITMASIIEGEAANDTERPNVASVMYNRLNNWDWPLLGMDSTVIYGAKLLGTGFDKALDSPYNTYLYPGLPKGPINNPGLSSIRAALYPSDTGYYYFATGKDGLNHFFTNEADHGAFVASDEYVGN